MKNLSGTDLFRKPCEFIMSGAELESLPPTRYPEIAFAGRSNVGKSSLVNALTNRGTLAHASNTPGRTQQINFFLLADALMLVDLPGHGYAKAPKTDIRQWTQLVKDYLTGRPNLKRVIFLIDSRHGIKEADLGIMKVLDTAAVTYQLVLTKSDKASKQELEKTQQETLAAIAKHPAAHPEIITTSSQTKDGIDRLRAELAVFAR